MFDIIRMDHFRRFYSYYAISYGLDITEKGNWEPRPGKELFYTIEQALGDIQRIC